MKRGDIFRVYRGAKYDPREYRVYLVVSRQEVVDSQFSMVICAPIYSKYDGIPTQVEIGIDEGMKHDCAVYCDELASFPKNLLTNYISHLSDSKMKEVNAALRVALDIE